MPSPSPDLATEVAVRTLRSRLALLQGDWPSEPALHNLSPQMVDALLNYMERRSKANARLRNGAGILFVLFEFILSGGMHTSYSGAIITGLLVGAFMWGGLEPGKKYAVYALTQTRDIRVLPTLLQATNNDWGNHPQVIGAICRLLQQITEADAGRLSQKMQNRLWAWAIVPTRLGPEYNEALVTSVLQAFAHVGSRETLARMERFTHEPATYQTHRQVNALLEQLIPQMEARLQRQEVPQTLLRASDASDAAPDTLLRAAHATTPEPTAQLLRASTSETSDETSLT